MCFGILPKVWFWEIYRFQIQILTISKTKTCQNIEQKFDTNLALYQVVQFRNNWDKNFIDAARRTN